MSCGRSKIQLPIAFGSWTPAFAGEQSGQASVDLLTGDEQLFHRLDADVEVLARLRVERNLDDALDSARADHDRDTDVEIVDAILPRQMRRTGKHPLLVFQKALRHRDRAGRRRVERASGLQQRDDLAAAAA